MELELIQLDAAETIERPQYREGGAEAEWEYAARGGSEERLYPWGSAALNETRAVYGCLGDDDSAAAAYAAAPPAPDEFSSDEDPLAWEGQGWEEFGAPR